MASPRGCEYRQVEISTHTYVNARGFVLPERADTPGRFAVCWDGLIYPVVTVGEPADLDRDIKDLTAHLKQAREAGESRTGTVNSSNWGFPREGRNIFSEVQDFYGIAGVDAHSPIKICLLLSLGRADLAEPPSSPPGRPGRPSRERAT